MKNFKNTKTYKIIIMALIIIIICSFCFSGKSKAKDSAYGGTLLNPVVDLIVHLGDGAMNIVHKYIYHQNTTTINVDMGNDVLEVIVTIIVGIAAAVALAALTVVTAGAAAAAFAAMGITLSAVSAGTVVAVAVGGGVLAGAFFASNVLPDNLRLPVYQISPEEIFSNRVNLFDVDFFNPNEDEIAKDKYGNKIYETIKDEDGNEKQVPVEIESTAKILRGVVSNWYIILRDIAVVALLSVLVYTGIRILLSLTSNDKAKYKQMLIDWLVAMCLLFFMQYIMSFSNILVDKLTDVITIEQNKNNFSAIIEDENGKIEKKLKDVGLWEDDLKDGNTIYWPTNLMGIVRVSAQIAKEENASYAGHAVMFIVLVLFTIYFIFTYLKRVLYMAFLTIIAPFVALTYPIDKMNDGKAQAFNMWFKEYIFNLLIQPLHLLIYTILVTSAFTLASENIIYSLVALGFMMPAEKLMRKFFGFEKAQTPGLLAGPAGAAMAMTGMNKLFGLGSKGKGGSSGGSGSGGSTDGEKPPRVKDTYDEQAAFFGPTKSQTIGSFTYKEPPKAENQRYFVEDENGNLVGGFSETDKVTKFIPKDPNAEIKTTSVKTDENGNVIHTLSDDYRVRENENYNPASQYKTIYPDDQSTNNSSRNQNNKNRTITKPSFWNATKAATKYYARGTANQIKRGAEQKLANFPQNAIKTAGRFAAGATGAALMGTAGLAVGVSSGDLTKTAQYTAGAAFGGYKAVTGKYDSVSDSMPIEGIGEAAEKAYYGSDQAYKQHKQEEYEKDFQRDEKNLMKLEMKYGSKEAKRIMKDDIPELLNNGIYDMKDITAIEDSIKDPNTNIRDLNEAITIRNGYRARMNTSTSKMKQKDKDEWRDTFKKEFDKKYPGQDTARMADNLFSKIEAYDRIRDSKD